MTKVTPIILLLSCVILLVSSTCIIESNNGTPLNITSLTYDPSEPPPPEYSYTDSAGNQFFINFCAQVSKYLVDCNISTSGSCQLSGGNYYSAGRLNTMANATFG